MMKRLFGISQEDIPLIFDEFYRARNIEKKEVCGAGIGLAICKHIITYKSKSFDKKRELQM